MEEISVFGLIAQKLQEKCGVAVELYRLYQAVEDGEIRMRGKPINFVGIRDQVFEQLAGSIAGEIDRLWAQDWDIDLIVLTGGGSRELARHLKPLIDGNVVPLEPHIDSRLNNVFGYVAPGTLPKTSSGKLQRSLCKDRYLSDVLV